VTLCNQNKAEGQEVSYPPSLYNQ